MPKHTVDQVPLLLRPLFFLYGWIGGIFFFVHMKFYRAFFRVEFRGTDFLDENPAHILSFWHENLPLFFLTHTQYGLSHCWLSYPYWHMKPIHVAKWLNGVKEIAYGASGIDGKRALNQVILRLKQGWSTVINPDGPKGPLKKVKDGVLLMSQYSGRPVISVRFKLEREWRIPTWDRKRYPVIFSKLIVQYEPPVQVLEDNLEECRELISAAMDDLL